MTSKETSRTITLELTETQAKTVQNATEFYARMGLGQIEDLAYFRQTHLWKDERGKMLNCDPETVRDLCVALKSAMFGFELGRSYGIHSPGISDEFRVSYDVHQVLRKALTKPNPERFITPREPHRTSEAHELPPVAVKENE